MSLGDLYFLVGGFLKFLFYSGLEWLQSSKYHQYTIMDLHNPETLSVLISKHVVDVNGHTSSRFDFTVDESDLGAGGTGTERSSLVATLEDGTKLHLFVKFPARKFAERVFLTMFKVYQNEVTFYDKMDCLPVGVSQLFPKSYCSKLISRNTGKFIIILEDISFRQGSNGNSCEFYSIKSGDFLKSDCKSVLSELARLHASCWGNPPAHVWHHDPVTGNVMGEAPPRCPVILKEGGKKVQERYCAVVSFPADVITAYNQSVNYYPAIRRFWSRETLTCCHGDSHVGNYCFFSRSSSGSRGVGMFDLQCMAAEHGMRDVSYHLVTSYAADRLAEDEEELIKHYITELKAHYASSHNDGLLDLSYSKAYFLYRCYGVTALHAFFASAGFAEMVIDSAAVVTVQRIVTTCHRLNILGAINDMIEQAKV